MSDRQPKRQSVQTDAPTNGPHASSPRPRRPLEVVESLLEEVVARQAVTQETLRQIQEDSATKADFRLVHQEIRATRQLLEQHMKEEAEERKARASRDQAVMGMLGDILSRLPST